MFQGEQELNSAFTNMLETSHFIHVVNEQDITEMNDVLSPSHELCNILLVQLSLSPFKSN